MTAFRHDWGVWLQLNGGKHEEGRSQVRLLDSADVKSADFMYICLNLTYFSNGNGLKALEGWAKSLL